MLVICEIKSNRRTTSISKVEIDRYESLNEIQQQEDQFRTHESILQTCHPSNVTLRNILNVMSMLRQVPYVWACGGEFLNSAKTALSIQNFMWIESILQRETVEL